jgi:hypothetical protein
VYTFSGCTTKVSLNERIVRIGCHDLLILLRQQLKQILMKNIILAILAFSITLISCSTKVKETEATEQPVAEVKAKHLFIDVHNLEPGKVTFEGVASAHQKDLATQGKYDVNFLKYWVDELAGKVYCLVESADSASISNSHKEAHGLIPNNISMVTDGPEAQIKSSSSLFFDIHRLGSGKVSAHDVAGAHEKDLAVQDKYGVNFINYWVDEKLGIVMCLAEAKDSASMVNAHKEAHGLIPDEVHPVKQGN